MYALKVIAEWQLKQYQDSVETANKGQRLCASDGGKTPRDCGMLSTIEGLVVNSETPDKFEKRRKARLTKELTQELASNRVGIGQCGE
jgi:hypothetical protein